MQEQRNKGERLEGDAGEVSILALVLVLARSWRFIVVFPVAAALLALGISFVVPNWYAATTKIMPPQQGPSSALALLGQLGGLASGATQALGLKNPSDIYVAMLRSRTVADRLIDRFDLKKIYNEDLYHFARKELAGNTSVTTSKDGMITVEVEDKDPRRAAEMANAYIEELRVITAQLAVSEAGQRRLFFEGQLRKVKDDLASAEVALKQFAEQSGMVSPESQIGLSVTAAASLRAHIASKEIQLAGMRTFATTTNPDLRRAQEELSGLRHELAKIEKTETGKTSDVLLPIGRTPEVALEYLRRYRETRYQETLFEALAKQYEIARIDEAKDATLVQVIDKALPPERKSKPRRLLVTVAVFIAALIAALAYVLASAALREALQDSQWAALWSELRSVFSRHRGAP
jgi:tyrosine-protein kinase Etk/Wzc